MKNMIGFKAFNKDLTCRDFKFEIGNTYELDCEPIPCLQGFHFCKTISETYKYYDMSDDTRICKIEAIGDVKTNDNIKFCTNKIIVIEEITDDCIRKCNINNTSSGYLNSGDCNSGNMNSGDMNSGNMNSGNMNSGNRNSGNRNSGNCNSGNQNSGYCNSGDCNSGNWNRGNWNSGYCNSGDCNSGDFNISNNNSGIFNTAQHTMMIFDKPSDWTYDQWLYSDARKILNRIVHNVTEWIDISKMTDEEKRNNPRCESSCGYLKVLNEEENVKIWWNSLNKKEKEIIQCLPNFDMDKFKRCVGFSNL